ncbi:MAG: hypothetical protein ACJAYA_001165 [Bacteroidia bacterium]|jgi:hypothetical protein
MIIKFYLTLVVFLLLGALVSTAQSIDRQVAASAGNELTNSSGTITYTIGEPVTETLSSGNATATQGFHQGIINITSVREQIKDLEISIYPNPTSDLLNVKFDGTGVWELHTLDGKLINTGNLLTSLTSIDMRNIALSTYTLTIILDDNRMNTYRIVKTH